MTLEPLPMSIQDANAFVAQFHRHSKPVLSAKFAIGATDGDRLVGVAIIGRPIARLMQDGWTAEVNRVCVLDDAPKGTPSFLYGRAWRIWQQMGGKRMLTYTLASESGASLRGAGWKVMGETTPGQWDRASRKRDFNPIYGQQKFRWEATV
jgi:hypothetical protein